MQVVAILVSIGIIILASIIGSRYPSLIGVIASMPLTVPLSIWVVHQGSGGDYGVMSRLVSGTLWGLILTLLFVLAVKMVFDRKLPVGPAIIIGYGVWLVGYLAFRYCGLLE